MIVRVAVVGHKNNPLYIQSFTEADDRSSFITLMNEVKFILVTTDLDVRDVKFILVTTDLDVRDADVRNLFRRFHTTYVDAVSNSFHVRGKKTTSKIFAERVCTIVKSFGTSAAG